MKDARGLAQKLLQMRTSELALEVLEQIVPEKTSGGFPQVCRVTADAAVGNLPSRQLCARWNSWCSCEVLVFAAAAEEPGMAQTQTKSEDTRCPITDAPN